MPNDLPTERPRIVAAAVKVNGVVHTGTRHGIIMREVWRRYGKCLIRQEDQGFVTDKGEFLNRFQSGAVAFRAGQTKTRKENLMSEDLW